MGAAKRGKRERAFTLIELLVVIAVIALLMAILIPALHRARNQARAVACRSNLRQWAMTLAAYTQDYEGRLPSDAGGGGAGLWLLRGTFIGAMDPNANHGALHGFHTRGIALCPMATKPGDNGGFSIVVTTEAGTWRAKGDPGSSTEAWQILTPEPPFVGSYGYNHCLFSAFRLNNMGAPLSRIRSFSVLSLRHHASIPVMLDATKPMSDPSISTTVFGPQYNTGRGQGLGMNMFIMNRHGRDTNGMFLDWSVRRVGLKELYTLKWASDFDRANPWTKAGGVQPEDWPKWMRECKDY
jgi:prepilin-type N-terminal cleavage/methylation domain-containing protein